MNYIKEINAFYDWLETNSLSDSAINLWHALMHINNRAGWITEFAVAISTLETKTGLKKDAIIRARHRLQQSARICFKSRTGQQSAIYSIISFDSEKTTQIIDAGFSVALTDTNHVTNREQSATQTATQTASIIKLNETKLNPVLDSKIDNLVYESFYAAHTRIYGFQCNPFQAEQLGAFIDKDGMEEAVIVRALERAATKKAAHNFKYILGILSGYLNSKCLTLSAAIVQDEEFERNAAENNSRNKGQPDQETILQLYQRKIGQTSFDTRNMIIGWVDHYGEEWVKNAIEWAYNSNKRESIEVSTILKLWKKSNLNEPWSRKVI